tara:strand:- start:340 stop:645 length:306 start_codon:yes stop_codon:yes gene_type:complete
MERFPGMVVLTTNMLDYLDDAFFRRFRFVIKFEQPNATMRQTLWKKHLPPRAPLDKDVDLVALANQYEFSGAVIKKCCFKVWIYSLVLFFNGVDILPRTLF